MPSDNETIDDGASVVRVGVLPGALALLEGVSTMEVLGDVFAYVSVQEEAAAWMVLSEESHVKDQIVKDNELALALLHRALEFFLCHHIQWLVESDRLLVQEALMPDFKDGPKDEEQAY